MCAMITSPIRRWRAFRSLHDRKFLLLQPLMALLFLASCNSASHTREFADLIQIPLPDFTSMEPSVQEQLQSGQSRLREALADPDADPAALSQLFGEQGQLFLAYELEQAAQACFANAWSLDSQNFRWAYYLGHLLYKEGKPEESRARYESALELNPDYLPTYIRLSRLFIEANQPDRAEPLLRKARKLDPSCAPALIGLGQVAAHRKDNPQAVEFFEIARRMAPAATEIHFPLGMAYRAMGNREKARFFLTRRGSDKARLSDPLLTELNDLATGSRAYNQRGDYATLQQRFQVAQKFYQQAVDAAPENPEYRIDLAATFIQLGQLDRAAEQLRKALQLAPKSGAANYNLAIVLSRQGRDQEAVAYHQKALAADPNHKEAHLNLASALLRLHRFDEAAADFQWVIDVDPLNSGALFGRAVSLIQAGHWQEASALLEDSYAAKPGDFYIASAFARLLAACPVDELRDGDRALEIANRLATVDRSLNNLELLAMALAEQGRFEEAVRLQRELLAATRRAGESERANYLETELAHYLRRQPSRTPLGR
jgi:tetratricopeptide (TPR) repeat protein